MPLFSTSGIYMFDLYMYYNSMLEKHVLCLTIENIKLTNCFMIFNALGVFHKHIRYNIARLLCMRARVRCPRSTINSVQSTARHAVLLQFDISSNFLEIRVVHTPKCIARCAADFTWKILLFGLLECIYKKSIKVCIFIRCLEFLTQALQVLI
jgi:hypothetical protein